MKCSFFLLPRRFQYCNRESRIKPKPTCQAEFDWVAFFVAFCSRARSSLKVSVPSTSKNFQEEFHVPIPTPLPEQYFTRAYFVRGYLIAGLDDDTAVRLRVSPPSFLLISKSSITSKMLSLDSNPDKVPLFAWLAGRLI